jgi:hypothetical protein
VSLAVRKAPLKVEVNVKADEKSAMISAFPSSPAEF